MLALPGPAAPALAADDPVAVTLILPHALRPGEIAFLEVTVGVVARGQEIRAMTPDGRLVGTVSPFGIRPGAEAGTYVIPVPADTIDDRRLRLQLFITRPDGPPRAPTAAEVKDVRLSILGARP